MSKKHMFECVFVCACAFMGACLGMGVCECVRMSDKLFVSEIKHQRNEL